MEKVLFNLVFRKNRMYQQFAKFSVCATSHSHGHGPKKERPKMDSRRVFKVYRYGGLESGEKPMMQTYELDVDTCGKMVLDALHKLKDMDPTLTFRRSCREGICGSCAICLQGHNVLSCITEIPYSKTITIHPLPHMYVKRDLVVDMAHFYKAYKSIRPYIIKHQDHRLGDKQFAQSIKDSLKMVGLYECVLCACCSTSCPSYWWNGRRFLGPHALLHAYRWVIDSRDDDAPARLNDLRDDFKAFRCHTIMNCTLACPKFLQPSTNIAMLKRLIAGLDKKEVPDMDPNKFPSVKG